MSDLLDALAEIQARDRLPDIPGYVHGIVSLDPPTVQCDGCGVKRTGRTLALAVILSGITFHPLRYDAGDHRRLCRDCWKAAS